MFFLFRHEILKRGAVRIEPLAEYDYWDLLDIDKVLKQANHFRVVKGKKWFDVLGFYDDSIPHFAISERIKLLLEEHHVTGWTCFPIVIDGFDAKYYVFQVLREVTGKAESLGLRKWNFSIDTSTWDGSDVFTMRDTMLFICTERVKEILASAKIGNLEITALGG